MVLEGPFSPFRAGSVVVEQVKKSNYKFDAVIGAFRTPCQFWQATLFVILTLFAGVHFSSGTNEHNRRIKKKFRMVSTWAVLKIGKTNKKKKRKKKKHARVSKRHA